MGPAFFENMGRGCRPLLPEGSSEDDIAFCNRLTVSAGVTVLPVSLFSLAENKRCTVSTYHAEAILHTACLCQACELPL